MPAFVYVPRSPTTGVLYGVVRTHLTEFLAAVDAETDGSNNGRDGPGRVLWGHRKIPMPPEPLRWLIAKGLVGAFSAIDRRVDRLARGFEKATPRRPA